MLKLVGKNCLADATASRSRMPKRLRPVGRRDARSGPAGAALQSLLPLLAVACARTAPQWAICPPQWRSRWQCNGKCRPMPGHPRGGSARGSDGFAPAQKEHGGAPVPPQLHHFAGAPVSEGAGVAVLWW